MLNIEYACRDCGKRPPESSRSMICECGGPIRGKAPGIHGTRDSFGIKNEFRDDTTGNTIDTWKKWEKAGYRQPKDVIKDGSVKEKVKENIKKRRNK